MNVRPILHSSSSSNGFPHRRVEKEAHPFLKENGDKTGSVDTASRELLVYLITCKIGHQVEVHLKNGSVYNGIFHAADVEKNFGIILKMACLVKDSRGTKSGSVHVNKPPSKLLIIPADDLVQVIAKDLPVSSNNASTSVQCEQPFELLTDSSISQSYHVDLERELKPWVPDEDLPDCSDLENVFDDPWKRGWNQFEVNKTLFGVTSTFDEELYTTKLERGPRTRDLEEQALRIAREIEGENTRDLHVAEERGLQLSGKFDIDEETKYSSVCTLNRYDDTFYEEEEGILLDGCNNMTFGDSSASDGKKTASTGKFYEEWGDSLSSRNNSVVDQSWSNSNKLAQQLMTEQLSEDFPAVGSKFRNESQLGEQRNSKVLGASHYKKPSQESMSGLEGINEDATNSDPADLQLKTSERQSSTDGRLVGPFFERAKSESSSGWPGSSISRNLENSAASPAPNRPILSPSSSIGSLSSEKSTLNPNAKEFKLNPNAKSFKPSPSATRPQSPVADGPLYYPPVPPMPGLHLRYGMGAAFPGQQQQQPMIYNNTAQLGPNPTFYSPQYPQQMMVSQQRPVLFMPPTPYQPEMPYKGRDSY